jgi:hypothetical protein
MPMLTQIPQPLYLYTVCIYQEPIRKNVFKDKQLDIKKERDALLQEKYTPPPKQRQPMPMSIIIESIKDSMVSAIANYLSCYKSIYYMLLLT